MKGSIAKVLNTLKNYHVIIYNLRMSDIQDEYFEDFDLDEPPRVQEQPETRPGPTAPTVEQLATGLAFGPYGNGVAYDAKNARNGPTDMMAAKLSDQRYGESGIGREYANKYVKNVQYKDLKKKDLDKIIANAKRSKADYVEDAPIGTFDDALRDAADVIRERKMQEERELKDAANDAIAAIDENEKQEDYENLNDAIAAIDENEKKQQTKKRKRGGKGRKTNTKSKKSKKQRKQRKNKSRKSSRRNQKK
jgi:hypothetical protein